MTVYSKVSHSDLVAIFTDYERHAPLDDKAVRVSVIGDLAFKTMKVLEVLLAVPKVGRVKANRAMKRAQASPSKTIGGLSERQRRDLTSSRLKGRS